MRTKTGVKAMLLRLLVELDRVDTELFFLDDRESELSAFDAHQLEELRVWRAKLVDRAKLCAIAYARLPGMPEPEGFEFESIGWNEDDVDAWMQRRSVREFLNSVKADPRAVLSAVYGGEGMSPMQSITQQAQAVGRTLRYESSSDSPA